MNHVCVGVDLRAQGAGRKRRKRNERKRREGQRKRHGEEKKGK